MNEKIYLRENLNNTFLEEKINIVNEKNRLKYVIIYYINIVK
jgi:hypothetical protein